MALVQIQGIDKDREKSAIEKINQGMGLVTSVANLYQTASPQPDQSGMSAMQRRYNAVPDGKVRVKY